MEPKNIKTIANLTKRIDETEIEKVEVEGNDIYFFYKNGKKRKMGKLFVTSVVTGSGETPTGDFATKEWVYDKDYAPKSWVAHGFVENETLESYALKTDLDGLASESWVESQGYVDESYHDSTKADTSHTHLVADITDLSLPTKTSDLTNDSGFITQSDVPSKTSELTNDSGFITQSDVPDKTSELTNDSGFITLNDIPTIPTKTSELTNDSGFIDNTYHDSTKADASSVYTKSETDNLLNNKANLVHTHSEYYEKTGGNISGNVDIDGTFKFNVDNPDYTVGVEIEPRIDMNRGTILKLKGTASGTNYKTSIENVGTPVNNYDAVNKKYVDDLLNIVWLTGIKDSQGITISSDAYEKCYDAITQNHSCYLKLTQSGEVAVLRLKAWLDFNDHSTHGDSFLFVDATDTRNTRQVIVDYNGATYSESELETTANKVVDFNNATNDNYPSALAVLSGFQFCANTYARKPVVVWEANTPSDYLVGIQSNLSASPSWQLTNLDLTPYKRIKVYSCAGQSSGATASTSTTAAMILEMSLDSRASISAYGGHFVGSVISQKPNNDNRLATLTCAVSSDKTSFVVLRQTNLYGTGATNNNDVNANVFMIEGYYD